MNLKLILHGIMAETPDSFGRQELPPEYVYYYNTIILILQDIFFFLFI